MRIHKKIYLHKMSRKKELPYYQIGHNQREYPKVIFWSRIPNSTETKHEFWKRWTITTNSQTMSPHSRHSSNRISKLCLQPICIQKLFKRTNLKEILRSTLERQKVSGQSISRSNRWMIWRKLLKGQQLGQTSLSTINTCTRCSFKRLRERLRTWPTF